MVLRGRDLACGEAVPDVDHGALPVDIAPGQREQLALAHAGLQCELEQRQEESQRQLTEDRHELALQEVRSLLAGNPWPLRARQPTHRVLSRDAMLYR